MDQDSAPNMCNWIQALSPADSFNTAAHFDGPILLNINSAQRFIRCVHHKHVSIFSHGAATPGTMWGALYHLYNLPRRTSIVDIAGSEVSRSQVCRSQLRVNTNSCRNSGQHDVL
jgi:hypothetical protein